MKILGFDLGDGESAVTLLDEDSTVEPRVIPLCGKTSLLSAVGVKNGRIVIGEAASVMDGAAEAKVRFKSRYLVDSSAAGCAASRSGVSVKVGIFCSSIVLTPSQNRFRRSVLRWPSSSPSRGFPR